MNTPRVSVVIPTRNSEKYLREALDSILLQTFADFELLIVDDASSDDTLSIIRGYEDSRIRVLTGPRKGLAAALNSAVREARGEYVARMDADDIAELTRLGKQVAFLDEHPEVGVCGTLFKQFMGGDALHNHMANVRYIDMIMGCYIGHPTAMFRRELFAKHDLFYNESMRFSEDYDLWTRAIRVTKLANIPEVLLHYRRHNESASIAHMDEMHGLDVGVKLRMIDHLVGGLSQDDASVVTEMLKGSPIDETARVGMLAKLMASNGHESLCSSLELLSVFHQIKPLAKDDLIRLSGDVVDEIPIFVISYNHLTYLRSIVSYFERAGFKNINIVDNASSYPPLLDYLRESPHKVHYMGSNYKHMVVFDSLKFRGIIDNQYFVLTDPDVLPVEECPLDFLYVFLDALLRHPTKNKVGFSLKLDDLPDHYELKTNVLEWEGRFYKNAGKCGDVTIYDAPIDTTFALYRPRKEWRNADFFAAFRVGAPYAARHLPWYRDISQLTDEEAYYRSVDKGSSNWNGTMSSAELHRKYGTGKVVEAEAAVEEVIAEVEGVTVTVKSTKQGSFRETFRRQRIGELRGYFLYGSKPLLNLRTVPRESLCTTLYAFGKVPLISKTTTGQHHVFRAFGVIPFWSKGPR